MNLTKGSKLHFIGIGGISMSGLAHILLNDGCIISGSDRSDCAHIAELRKMGAKIFIGHDGANVGDVDTVVYSAAIGIDNPELCEARRRGIETVDRAALMGAVMKNYALPIAVSGTHGKTTTTGMLTQIFLTADADPTVTIGGDLDAIGGNIRIGGKEFFICEACEYHQSFLRFFPKMSLILNIEADHLDYFKNLDHIIDTFRSLALLTPRDGFVIANADSENVQKALSGVERRIVTFSLCGKGDYNAQNLQLEDNGTYSFDVEKGGETLFRVTLSVVGKHNVADALAAAAAAHCAGIAPDVIAAALALYGGTHRRFEHRGSVGGCKVIDDYAHHPTEIKATLDALRDMRHGEMYVVFQPHTYTRTKTLFDDFVRVFSNCGAHIIITDIYAAREKDMGIVSAMALSENIPGSIYMKEFETAAAYLRKNIKPGDVVLTMGAGDVYKIGEMLLEKG